MKDAGSNGNLPAMMLQPGASVDCFKILRLIGKGGMGEVYLARDIRLGRKVALKVLDPEKLGPRSVRDRLLAEARATASFNHPHIVTVYSVGEFRFTRSAPKGREEPELGSAYLALEFLEGQTLRERLKEDPPSVMESVRIGLAVAGALQEAHRQALTHGDLKPENIIIPGDGRLRVLDFGLAQGLQSDDHQPDDALPPDESGRLLETFGGTPAYMAPEQWRRQQRTMTADIWALGTILFEMLCGRRPYPKAGGIPALRARVTSDDPVPRLEVTAHLSEELVDCVARCLEKDPGSRPSAAQVIAELSRLANPASSAGSTHESPFRGLLPFTERHADLFFGRDAEVSAFVERLRRQPVLPIVGPSGAGKSSFVHAGVIPRLREQRRWLVIQLRPGDDPFRRLAHRVMQAAEAGGVSEISTFTYEPPAGMPDRGDPVDTEQEIETLCSTSTVPEHELLARQQPPFSRPVSTPDALHELLASSPTRLALILQQLAARLRSWVLLLVDQAEELYTLVHDASVRERFMQAICTAADDAEEPVRVIFTLRDDYLARMAVGREAQEALGNLVVMRSPGPVALEEILVRPLQVVGYRYDDASLVTEMIAAVDGETAGLPLLQFTTQMLWERRDHRKKLLLRATYESIGGVGGAIVEHADGVLAPLSADQLRTAREVLTRLVTSEGTRAVVPRPRLLDGMPAAAEQILDRLVEGRLVAVRRGKETEEAELELAHESLISRWRRLGRWIEESKDDLALAAQIDRAAELWQQRGNPVEEVWRGKALSEASEALERRPSYFPEGVRQFISAGLRLERQQRLRARVRRAAAYVLLAIIAATSAIVAWTISGKEQAARHQLAVARREGAAAALARGDLLEARAKLRGSLETEDSQAARALWWRLARNPLVWKRTLGGISYQVAFSPRGRTIAASCEDRTIYLMDLHTGRARTLRGHEEQVFAVSFSPDGARLASGSWDGTVMLWELGDDRSRVLGAHSGAVMGVAFSSDGRSLVSGSWDQTLRVWDLAASSSAPPGKAPHRVLRQQGDPIYGVALSPRGRTVATGAKSGAVRLWNLGPGAGRPRVLRGHTATVWGLAFSADGSQLASGSWDRTVRLWDPGSGSTSRVLRDHSGRVYGVAFSPDGKQLVSVGDDRSVRLWDLASGGHRSMSGTKRIIGVDVSPDGRYIVSAGADHAVSLWRVSASRGRSPRGGHSGRVYSVDFRPDGGQVASGGHDGAIRLWSVATGATERVMRGHEAAVTAVSYSPDGRRLASGSTDRSVRIWNVSNGALEHTLPGHRDRVYHTAFSPDGKRLASASHDKTVRLWNARSGADEGLLRGHDEGVYSVAFSPDGRRLATGSFDRTVRIWSVADSAVRRVLSGHGGAVYGVAFSADGKQLASAAGDGTVRVWDAKTGTGRILHRWSGRLYQPTFDRSGKHVAVASSEGAAYLLSLSGGAPTALLGHRSEVNDVAFSPDGKQVATASDDGTVRLWAAATGLPLWRAPMILTAPPRLLTHKGWLSLNGAGRGGTPPPRAKWLAAVEARGRAASVGPNGALLCLQTVDHRLELWDMLTDRQLSASVVSGLERVLASAGGCVTLARGTVRLHDKGGRARKLRDHASAIAQSGDKLLVAAGGEVLVFERGGRKQASYRSGPGVTALLWSDPRLILGFGNGQIEILPTSARASGTIPAFTGLPSSQVMTLLPGPPGTLVVGFANGEAGLWSLDDGSPLDQVALHGPVTHLTVVRRTLQLATELGDHRRFDLGFFYRDYCQLLRSVWQQVPVSWEAGRAVPSGLPHEHRCKAP